MGEDRFIGGVAEARGIPLDPARDKARTYAIYLDLIRGTSSRCRASAIRRRRAAARGLRLAVASSADAIKVAGNLDEIGLPPSTFDVVVDGSQVARKKPAPDIFLEACRRLGLDPAACLVDRGRRRGVAAAKAAGCRCLAVTTSFPAEKLAAAGRLGRRGPRPRPARGARLVSARPGLCRGGSASVTIGADRSPATRRPGAPMPVLDREEYIEQAYFFQAFRERLLDGMPAQDILARVGEELLSTTRLPLAISFLLTEIKADRADGPGDGPDRPLLHPVPDPRRSPRPSTTSAGSRWTRRS